MIKFCKKCGCNREHYADYKCKVCKAAYTKANRLKNAERIREQKRLWAEQNKERRRQLRAKHYAENREAAIEYAKQYRKANREAVLQKEKAYRDENKSRRAEYKRTWVENNRHRVAGYNRPRAASNIKARCKWADHDKVRAVYREAQLMREAGIDAHVDHVVPLKHPLVCGLHNEFNLQILSGYENIAKHNKFNA